MPPIPPTTFPDGAFAKLMDAILAKLRADPVLKRVKTWQTEEGDRDDNRALTLRDLPALAISTGGGPFKWADECRFDGPLVLRFTLAVPSRRKRELLNFWEAVAKALSPTNAFMDILYPLGVYNVTMTIPAVDPQSIADGQGLAGEGQVTLSVNVGI